MLRRHLLSAAVFAAFLPSIASAQVELKFKHVPGRSTKTTSTAKFQQTISFANMTLDNTIDSETVTSAKVGEKTADGLIPLETKTVSLKMDGDFGGGATLHFDSSKADDNKASADVKFLEEIMTRSAANAMTIKVDADGMAKAVEGAEKLLENIDQLSPRAQDGVKSSANVETIKREFNENVKKFEPGLVRKGDTWERTDLVSGIGQPIKMKKKYEYQGTVQKDGKEYDKVDVKILEASLEPSEGENAPAKITKSDLKVASSEGWILFDREAGLQVEEQSKVKIKGPMTLHVSAMDMNLDLDGEIEFTVESHSKTVKAE